MNRNLVGSIYGRSSIKIVLYRSGQNEHSWMNSFHRCFLPSFCSFGQAVLEENFFRNRPIRNKNCLWRPCLLTDWDEMNNLYRGPSIYASYQVSVHLAKWAMWAFAITWHLLSVVCCHILIFSSETTEPNEPKLVRKYLWKVLCKHSSFRPETLTSDEKIKMWQQTTDNRCQVIAKAHIALGKVS
jgi:hypothetical protein